MKSSSGVNLDPEGFPVRLKAIRCFRNLKQVEIAKALGISSTVYSSWETGNHLPRGNNYTRLAQILNVPIELLVEGPKNGESVEDYLQLAVSKKFLSVLDCNSLNVDSKLPEILKNSSKINFSLLDGFENFYKEQKMFLYKIDDDSMARSFSNSINKGMTAVIICEPNIRIYNQKPVLLAVEGQNQAMIREISFDNADLVLTAWNSKYSSQKIDLKKTKVNIFGYVAMVFEKFF